MADALLCNEEIKSEMYSILAHGTWPLMDLPPRCKTIGCKWILKKKGQIQLEQLNNIKLKYLPRDLVKRKV